MSARKTNLSVSALTLTGVPLGKLTVFRWNSAPQFDEGKGVADQDDFPVAVKQGDKVSLSANLGAAADGSGAIQTNIEVTAFTFDAVAYIGRLKNGTIRIENRSADGSRVAYRSQHANKVGRTIVVTGDVMLDGTASTNFVQRRALPGGEALGSLVVTLAGQTLTLTECTIESAEHVIELEGIQMERVVFKNRANAVAPALSGTPNNLLAAAIATDPAVAFSINTGAGAYDVDDGSNVQLFIDSLEVSFNDGAINKLQLEGTVRGQFGADANSGVA